MKMSADHKRDHEAVAKAIASNWLADRVLLVHLARAHGLRVEDAKSGLAILIVGHDHCHGRSPVFEEAERACHDDGLRKGLAYVREYEEG